MVILSNLGVCHSTDEVSCFCSFHGDFNVSEINSTYLTLLDTRFYRFAATLLFTDDENKFKNKNKPNLKVSLSKQNRFESEISTVWREFKAENILF